MKRYGIIGAIAFVLVFIISRHSPAFDEHVANLSLKDLKAVSVQIEPLREEIEKEGLRRSDIQELVIEKLQIAGIQVVSGDSKLEGNPILNVGLSITNVKNRGVYHCAIHVVLYQDVYLVRNPGQKFEHAITWVAKTIGETPDLERIKLHVGYKVDEFIKDYLSANPKEGAMDKLKELKKYIK